MKTRGGAMLRALFVAALVIGLLVLVGRGIDFRGDVWEPLASGDPAAHLAKKRAARKARPVKPKPTTLAGLPCFRCHNIGRYRAGKKFPHDLHKREGLYHCHLCHAFAGHMEVRIRKDKCSECHDKDE